MHVLFVVERDSKQGAALSAMNLVKGLYDKYPDITYSIVVPIRFDRADFYEEIGCAVYRLPYACYSQGVPDRKWQYPIRYVEKWIKYHLGKALTPILLFLYTKTGKLDMRKIDIVHCNSSRLDVGAYLASKYKKPLVQHIREFGDVGFQRFHLRKNYIEYMNKNTTWYVAVSEAVKWHWIRKGIDKNKAVCIYNGVDAGVFIKDCKKKDDTENAVTRFLFMGGMAEAKGQHQALEALASLPDDVRMEIDIVGGVAGIMQKNVWILLRNIVWGIR